MNRKIWDLYALVYERAMRSDRRIIKRICKRISRVVKDMEVLELATGPEYLDWLESNGWKAEFESGGKYNGND